MPCCARPWTEPGAKAHCCCGPLAPCSLTRCLPSLSRLRSGHLDVSVDRFAVGSQFFSDATMRGPLQPGDDGADYRFQDEFYGAHLVAAHDAGVQERLQKESAAAGHARQPVGMANVYQMGSLQTHLTANAYGKAQGEFQAALDAERAAKAMLQAQLNSAVAEASAVKQQLALQTARAAAAEAAAEAAAAREAVAVGRASKLEDEERCAEHDKAAKSAGKEAAKAAKAHAVRLSRRRRNGRVRLSRWALLPMRS